MADVVPSAPLPFARIFHPTDFSADSHTAFVHALKLALLARAELTIMHVDPSVTREGFEDFPRVRPLLARWGAVAASSSKADVAKLGVKIKKIRMVGDHPSAAILQHLKAEPADLIVLATHQYEGFARWRHDSVAEPVVRAARTVALVVPAHVQGFVHAASGLGQLRRVLIPVSQRPDPQPAVDMAAGLASALDGGPVTFTVAHAGDEAALPSLQYPHTSRWAWDTLVGRGSAVDWILAAGAEFDVDLIVMTTEGRDSLLDSLFGSTTERVVRGARCPVLAIPAW